MTMKPMCFVPLEKRKFKSIGEAKQALILDKLGAAYVKGERVFVITAHGTGEFSYQDWKRYV